MNSEKTYSLKRHAQFTKTINDDFNEDGYIHYFHLNQLLTSDLDLINHFVSVDFGNGEFEVSTAHGIVISINYITDDQDEFEANFIRKVEEFINIELTNFLGMNKFVSIH